MYYTPLYHGDFLWKPADELCIKLFPNHSENGFHENFHGNGDRAQAINVVLESRL